MISVQGIWFVGQAMIVAPYLTKGVYMPRGRSLKTSAKKVRKGKKSAGNLSKIKREPRKPKRG
jgi:hypothetical protein